VILRLRRAAAYLSERFRRSQAFCEVINRFEQIYRQATMRLLTFTEEVTNDKEVMKKLLSVGFEYVCQKDSRLLFRKRK